VKLVEVTIASGYIMRVKEKKGAVKRLAKQIV
jgi:hypothetical protein